MILLHINTDIVVHNSTTMRILVFSSDSTNLFSNNSSISNDYMAKTYILYKNDV